MTRDTRIDVDAAGTRASRDVLPDLLRGLSLLGIVVVNAPYLGSSTRGFSPEAVASTVDATAAFLVIALAHGKFFLLFSFLFGYSLAYVLRDDRPDGRARFRRRLLILAAFGIAHALLLFAGDILLTYAVLGVVLLRLARAPAYDISNAVDVLGTGSYLKFPRVIQQVGANWRLADRVPELEPEETFRKLEQYILERLLRSTVPAPL